MIVRVLFFVFELSITTIVLFNFKDRTIKDRIFTFDEIIFWMKISCKGNSGILVMQIFC